VTSFYSIAMATSRMTISSVTSTSPINHNFEQNKQALETPKINEAVLAKLDKAGAHFKFVQMFRKLKAVILND
jgi:hypothetical protein